MTANVAAALNSGFAPQQIIDTILKKGGPGAQKIKAALEAGYSPDEIVSFLAGDYSKKAGSDYKSFGERMQGRPGMTPAEMQGRMLQASAENSPFTTAGAYLEPVTQYLPDIAKTFAMSYGIGKLAKVAAPYAASMFGGGIFPSGPAPTSPSSPSPIAPQGPAGGILQPLKQAASQAIQGMPQGTIKNIVKGVAAAFGFKNAGLVNVIADLAEKTGMSIEQIKEEAAKVGDISTPEKAEAAVKTLQNASPQEVISDISKYKQEALQGIEFENLSRVRQDNISNVLSEIESLRQQGIPSTDKRYKDLAKKIKNISEGKGLSFADKEQERFEKRYERKPVLLKDGEVGDLKDVKKGVAEIEMEDGKIRRQKVDDVTISPLPQRDLADLYSELMDAIPEEEKSAPIYWAGYDEPNKRFHVIFHGAPLYTYENISEDFAEKIKNSGFVARTSGKTKEGEWFVGGASRGSGLYDLIKELQQKYGGKGKEYSGKAAPVFDVLAKPREAYKAREKERKSREKEDKKKKKV